MAALPPPWQLDTTIERLLGDLVECARELGVWGDGGGGSTLSCTSLFAAIGEREQQIADSARGSFAARQLEKELRDMEAELEIAEADCAAAECAKRGAGRATRARAGAEAEAQALRARRQEHECAIARLRAEPGLKAILDLEAASAATAAAGGGSGGGSGAGVRHGEVVALGAAKAKLDSRNAAMRQELAAFAGLPADAALAGLAVAQGRQEVARLEKLLAQRLTNMVT